MSAAKRCPVPWCTWDPGECNGDHWAGPGEGDWPDIEATAYVPLGHEYLCAAPTWDPSVHDGPAVLLWVRRVSREDVVETDESFDLTPDEAEALANQLIRAAQTARATSTN